MRGLVTVLAVTLVLSLGLVEPAAACPPDSARSGTVCMDKYEASVWHVPPEQTILITKIRKGTATLANLTSAGAVAAGVVQLGLETGDLAANGCPGTGNGCVAVYAVSIPGARPAAFITWFQAAAAARNSRKRLPTNQEWQVAALGTPDTGGADNGSTTCNTDNLVPGVARTGERSACFSNVGAFDMVGNVQEWVADWDELPNRCVTWSAEFGTDLSCVGGAGVVDRNPSNLPGALVRGGKWDDTTNAGVFYVAALFAAGEANHGFRCARQSP